MTHVTRVFNPQTRSLTGVERRYAGQVGDSISTVLHFEYTQLGFLSEYVPYIMFGVYGDDGNPLIYGPEPENPSEVMMTALEDRIYFDGIEFSIPWAVTSRVKSARVDYQLFFVKVGVEFDGRNVAQLKPTEVIMSAIDSIALKPSISCDKRKPAPCCPPFAPTGAEPNVIGWVNLWKDYGIVLPVSQDLKMPEFIDRFGVPYEPTEQQQIENPPIIRLNFRTYNGKNDSSAEFTNVPVMIDGKIIYYQIPFGNTEKTYPLLRGTIEDGQSIVYSKESNGFVAYDVKGIYQFRGTCTALELDTWEDTKAAGDRPLENGDVYSCTEDRFYGIDEQGNKELYKAGTNWVWSEQERFEPLTGEMDLTKYQLESAKINDWTALADDPEIVSEKLYPTARLVKASLDDKLDDAQLIRNWSAEMTDEMIPSAPLVKTHLDSKLDDTQLVTEWNAPTDEQIPSAKLVKDSVDQKTDIVMAIPNWTKGVRFSKGATVIYNGTIFISLIGGNTSQPVDDEGVISENWTMVQGGSGDGEAQAQRWVIGNKTATSYTITHNFGTKDLFVSIREKATGRIVDAAVTVLRPGAIRIDFTEPPGINTYYVTVSPAIPSAPPLDETTTMEFLTDSTEWRFEHGFHRILTVQTFNQNGVEIVGSVKQDVNSLDTVVVEFNQPVRGTMVVR